MKINERERRFLLAGGLVVAAFIFYFFVYTPLQERSASDISSRGGSIEQLYLEAREKEDVVSQLDDVTEQTSVKILDMATENQVEHYVKTVEKVAGQSGVGISQFAPKAVSATNTERARRPGSEASFELQFGTSHGGLLKFLKGLKEEGLPYYVESIQVDANMQKPDTLSIQMDLSFYLLEPMSYETAG